MTHRMFFVILALFFSLSMLWSLTHISTATTACNVPTLPTEPLLAVYALAFDTASDSPFDLSADADTTLNGLQQATAINDKTIAAVLVDRGEVGDSELLLFHDGNRYDTGCLPLADGTIDDTQTELDMADGAMLGGLIRWARDSYPATHTTFSYIGHGLPVVPAGVDPTEWEVGTRDLSPLPTWIDVNPSFTDAHAPDAETRTLITPHALRTALQIGSNDGAEPLAALDLLHCFGATIEELYEVAGDFTQDQLYVEYTVATGSYAFFDPLMPGAALELLRGHLGSARSVAFKIGYVYDDYHPVEGHPHVISVVDNQNLPLLYDDWATISAEILNEFDADPAATVTRLETIYNDSRKFDGSYCEQDFALAPPDPLSNFKDMAVQMEFNQFAHNPTIIATVRALRNNHIYEVVPRQFSADGVPWFDGDGGDVWDLSSFRGLGLFTPFELQTGGYMPWQSQWYTSGQTIVLTGGVTIDNPHPLAFLTPDSPTTKTWADVMARYWAETNKRPGIDLPSGFCGVELTEYAAVLADLEMDSTNNGGSRSNTIDYTFVISNQYGVTATGVTISYTLPPSSTYVGAMPDVCAENGRVVTCSVGEIADEVALTIQTIVDPAAIGVLEGYARISADTHDPIERTPVVTTVVTTAGVPLAVGLVSAETTSLLPFVILLIAICFVFTIRLCRTQTTQRRYRVATNCALTTL